MRRLIARLFNLEVPRAAARALEPPSPPPDVSPARLSRLEERVDFLEGALNRLRGQVTGGLAHRPKPTEEPETRQDAPGSTIAPEGDPHHAADRWMALASHRAARRAK